MSEGKKTEYEEEIELAETAKLNENFSLPPSREASPAIMPQSTSSKGLDLNSPVLAVLSYCGSSILMTVSNKYMVNGTGFNLPFVLLVVQVSLQGL
jgi:GDP-mannose transporter